MSVRLAVFLVLVFSVVVITHHETKPWDVGSWVDTLASLPNVAYSWIDGLKSGPAAFWGSLLGVFGAVLAVLIGVWSNARLNRVAMARALNYEITHLVSRIQVVYFTLSGAIHIAQPRGRDSFCGDILSSISVTYLRRIVQLPEPQIFPRTAEKTGLLGSRVGPQIARFYSSLMALSDRFDREFPEDSDTLMTFIYLNNIESNLKYTLENGQDAIESLDRYTGKGLFRHLRK